MPRCKQCGEYREPHEMEYNSDTCKFCTGKYQDPCKDCGGEDCVCCPYYNGY